MASRPHPQPAWGKAGELAPHQGPRRGGTRAWRPRDRGREAAVCHLGPDSRRRGGRPSGGPWLGKPCEEERRETVGSSQTRSSQKDSKDCACSRQDAARAKAPAPAKPALGGNSGGREAKHKRPAADDEASGKPSAGSVSLPDFIAPCLAELRSETPATANYVHEIKFDGYRMQARVDHGRVALKTRTGLDWTAKFKGAAALDALAALPCTTALIDGELVVEAASGVSDFSALQGDLAAGRVDRMVFFAFDLLHLDGQDLTREKLVARKAGLEKLLAGATGPLRYSEHMEEGGPDLLRHACRLSLEGVVSKRRDAPYRSGRTGGLDQVEMLGAAGVRDWRLHAVHDVPARGGRAGRRRV